MHLGFSKEKGFTLIELLVVVSIISLLSSVVFASLNSARAKGRDARKKFDLEQINTTLQRYWIDNNSSPTNPTAGIAGCTPGFSTCMQELISPNYFSKLPVSPIPSDFYSYYDYGTYFNLEVHLESDTYGPGTQGYHCSDTSPNGAGTAGTKMFCLEFNKY